MAEPGKLNADPVHDRASLICPCCGARLALKGRVVKLLDLSPAFRAYVQMILRHAVFGVHGIAPVNALTGMWPKVSTWLRSRHPIEATRASIRWRITPE